MKSIESTPVEVKSESLLSAEEIEEGRLTAEIVDRYRAKFQELTGEVLLETITAHFVEADPDGLPPIINSRACEQLDYIDGNPEMPECKCEEGNVCQLCYTDDECYECGKNLTECDCDQFEPVTRIRKYSRRVSARWQKDKNAEDSGEFLASTILEHANPIFRAIAEEAARTVGVPETLTVVEVLGALSCAIGKGLDIESRPGRNTQLATHFLGFARSGTGKSESMSRIFKPLYDKQKELRESWQKSLPEINANLKVNQARLAFLMKDAGKGTLTADGSSEIVRLEEELKKLEREKNSPPSVYTEDTTLAALRDLLDLNACQISSVSDDAGKAIQNLLGEHSNLKQPEDNLYLKMYSGQPVTVDRVTKGSIYLPDPWGNMFWLSQPDKISLLIKNQWLSEGGFLCRCMVAKFECVPHVMSDDDVSPKLSAEYCAKWNLVYNAYRQNHLESGERKLIKVSTEAKTFFKRFEQYIVDLRSGIYSDVDSFGARWVENAWRLAGILHVSRHLDSAHEKPLEVKTAEKAVKLTGFFLLQQMEILHESRATAYQERLAKITQFIAKNGGSTTLAQFKKNGYDPTEVLNFAKLATKWIEVVPIAGGPGKGRPGFQLRLLGCYVAQKDKS